jgi:hypothetical protein
MYLHPTGATNEPISSPFNMIYETTNLPAPTRHRLLHESNRTIVMLEDHCRLLDKVIAMRQNQDALLSSSRPCRYESVEKGVEDSSVSQFTTSHYPPSSYHSYHASPIGVRPTSMVFPPIGYSRPPEYISQSLFSKHPSSIPLPQPQAGEKTLTVVSPKMPVLIGSRPALNEERNDYSNSYCCSVSKLPQRNRKLPPNFRLSPNTVVLGKGKGPKEASGNMRLQELVRDSLDKYIGSGRHGKMLVISKIIEQIQSENTNHNVQATPAFVRFQNNFWWEVTEKECRVKLSATFRDLLSDKYRSSSKSKVEYRRQQRQHKKEVSEFVDAVRALKTLKA